jgi:hypothetical protein
MEARRNEAITSGAVTVRKVQEALESAGVEFTNGGQPGVRINTEVAAINREANELRDLTAKFRGKLVRRVEAGGTKAEKIAAANIDDQIAAARNPADTAAQSAKNTLSEKRRGLNSVIRRLQVLVEAGLASPDDLN